MDRRSCHKRTVVTTSVTGSSPRLADRYLEGFLWLLLELRLLLGKGNEGTLSGYKHLSSALTKLNVCYKFVCDDSAGGLFTK